MQVELRGFRNPITGMMDYTCHQAGPTLFGHKECLVTLQRIS